MKCVYKIGRMYLVSSKLFSSYDPFLVDNLQCDDEAECFFDGQGNPAEKPATLHADRNVLFISFTSSKPDLSEAVKVSTSTDMTIWRSGNDWVYDCHYADGWLQITPDYTHATYYCGYPDEHGWIHTLTQPIQTAVECSLVMQGYIIVHAACVELEEKAVLFSAASGVGKSTRANRWVEAFGATMISGDRPIIDPIRGKALGAPWDGKEGIHSNTEVRIAAFNCLQRAEKTKLTRMTAEEKKRFLATQTFIPMWDPMLVAKVFAGINQMIERVNIWSLACDQTIQAARECHDILFPKDPETLPELLSLLKALDTPKDDYRDRINSFLEFKARKLGVPIRGVFELTPLCNLDCKMCYVHLQKQQMSGCSLLSAQQWKAYIKDAYDAGMRFASLTGGECLTYPGFDEVYLYMHELGIDTHVLTNGLLLNEQRIAFFKQHPSSLIQVTLYGSDDDAYEKVTGVRCFQQVYQNIMKAKEAGLPIQIAVTPNAFGYEDLPKLLQLAEKTGIVYRINSILNHPRENTGRDLHDLTDDQYVEILRLQAQLKSRQPVPVDPAEIQDVPHSGKAEVGIKCGAGRSNFAISWQGHMVPCISLSDLYPSRPIGEFMEDWHAINSWANSLPVPEECDACAYQAKCIQCIAIHYNSENPGHCNPGVCRRKKK